MIQPGRQTVATRKIRVLMVCLGNICRSPTAHAVFDSLVEQAGLQHAIEVDSAGTGNWHIGEAPDKRAVAHGLERGYQLESLRARQVEQGDFTLFDYILAMDRNNLKDLKAQCPGDKQHKLSLLLDHAVSEHESVPDPYYAGPEGFTLVLDLVEDACGGLIQFLKSRHELK